MVTEFAQVAICPVWLLVLSNPDASTQGASIAVLSYRIVTDPPYCAPMEEGADPTPETSLNERR